MAWQEKKASRSAWGKQYLFAVLWLSISTPSRTKGNKIILFTRCTIRDRAAQEINHHCHYHTDQEQHLTACSRFHLEYLEALCHARENHKCHPGFPTGCSTCSSNKQRLRWCHASLALPCGSPKKHHTPLCCCTGRDGSCQRCHPLPQGQF